jgi:hypothetical protein
MKVDIEKFWDSGRPLLQVETILAQLKRERHWLTTRETELISLALVDGFCELFPQHVERWQSTYSFVFEACEDIRMITNEKTDGRAGSLVTNRKRSWQQSTVLPCLIRISAAPVSGCFDQYRLDFRLLLNRLKTRSSAINWIRNCEIFYDLGLTEF